MWFYYEKDKKKGPFDEFAILHLIQIGSLTADMLVEKKSWKQPRKASVAFKDQFHLVAKDLEPQKIQVHPSFSVNILNVGPPVPDHGPLFLTTVGIAAFFIFLFITLLYKGLTVIGLILLIVFAFAVGAAAVFGILFDRFHSDHKAVEERMKRIQDNQDNLDLLRSKLEDYRNKLYSVRDDIEARKKRVVELASDAVLKRASVVAGAYLDKVLYINGKKLNPTNYPECRERLKGAVDSCRLVGMEIAPEKEKGLFDQLKIDYETAVRIAAEREAQRQIKEKIREETERLKEIEEEKERTQRDQERIEEELKKAIEKAKGEFSAEVERLKKKLAEAEARAERAKSMAQLTKAGHVYILSNIGSFGNDVYKIGMTRRLDPMERVYELSGASVPFPFDVHAMISCEDAPKLENLLHRALHRYRLNKVNFRKEYFQVNLDQIIQIVEQNFGKVEYIADAEALQFIQSQNVSLEDLDFLDQVQAKLSSQIDEED